MAALIMVGALAIANKVGEKKEKKRQKKASDEKRYRQLQVETNQRIARRESGTMDIVTEKSAAPPYSDTTNDDVLEDDDENANVKEAVNDPQPPAYEDAVQVGERREREWKERRRSSVASGSAMRMG